MALTERKEDGLNTSNQPGVIKDGEGYSRRGTGGDKVPAHGSFQQKTSPENREIFTRQETPGRILPFRKRDEVTRKQTDEGEEDPEEVYATQLAQIRTLQRVYQDIENLRQEGESFGHPSYFKYFICGSIALLKDGLDILFLIGVVTIPLWWAFGPILSLTVLIIFWIFDIKQQRAKNFMKNLEQRMEVIQANIVHAVRIASMIPGVKKRVAAYGVTKITSFVGRSPTVKIAIGTGAEAFPIVSLIPWNTLSVILAYLDERKICKNAAQNGAEAHAQLSAQLNEAA